jgi:hypothetical protein
MNLSVCEDHAQHRLPPSCNLMLQVNDGSFLCLIAEICLLIHMSSACDEHLNIRLRFFP